MKRPTIIARVGTVKGLRLTALAGLGAAVYLAISASPLGAAQVRVRDGQEVRLLLHNVLTTENVEKEDTIDFDVGEDVVVNGHVVIAKGAPGVGKVVGVKGAGKKKAKDASVTFRFISVRSVDNQQIPLRALPYKGKKKGDAKENDVVANDPIPGYPDRVIGAEKGKPYPAFLDSSAVINAPETAPIPVSTPAPTAAQPAAPAPAQPTTQPAQTPTQPAPAVGIPEQESASIDFASEPSGADIYIDGSFLGNTPSTLRVAAGRHRVELRLSGYRTWTQSMPVDPGSHPRVSKTLEKE